MLARRDAFQTIQDQDEKPAWYLTLESEGRKLYGDDAKLLKDWETTLQKFVFEKSEVDMVFLDEIQFMKTDETLENVENILNNGIDVVSSGLDQDSRGRPWETSSMLLGLSDKIIKIYGFCNVCGMEATKTYRKTEGGGRTQVGAADIYEPRCLKHWEAR